MGFNSGFKGLIQETPVIQSVSRSVSRSVNQFVSQSVGQSVGKSVGQSLVHSVGQSVGQQVIRSVSHSVLHIGAQRLRDVDAASLFFQLLPSPVSKSFPQFQLSILFSSPVLLQVFICYIAFGGSNSQLFCLAKNPSL